VFGSLTDLFGPGVLHHQFARIRAKQLLSLWIQHLVYCWQTPAEAEVRSTLIGRPEEDTGRRIVEFRRVAEPAQHLEALVKRYDQGQELPLLLFPTTSLLYAELVSSQKVDRGIEGRLQKCWEQELEDARLTRVFGSGTLLEEIRPLGVGHAGFEELALEIFEPLLEHRHEPEEDP
jgi:exonuclease V gamma subunit